MLTPEACAVVVTLAGEQAQVGYGTALGDELIAEVSDIKMLVGHYSRSQRSYLRVRTTSTFSPLTFRDSWCSDISASVPLI